jgi:hypothetical protein
MNAAARAKAAAAAAAEKNTMKRGLLQKLIFFLPSNK